MVKHLVSNELDRFVSCDSHMSFINCLQYLMNEDLKIIEVSLLCPPDINN